MERQKMTMDGNMAAAYVAYGFTEVAVIYPITPSSPMADYTDVWARQERENLFGKPVLLRQMQSEAGVAGAMHGALLAGALTTTFTSSQGLLLMIPNLYKMAGEQLPAVIHVAARTVATHALSIFGDHSDVYACRQTGCAMLCSNNVQEVMDLAAVAHLSAIAGKLPFLHFFDGFRTSHELQKVQVWSYDTLGELWDEEALKKFREEALSPNHPFTAGTAQNPDTFFQMREASNGVYESLVDVVEDYMHRINEKIGTTYELFEYYGQKDGETVMIAMGSVCNTIEEVIDAMSKKGEKIGLIKVRLYRPFSKKHLLQALPKTVRKIVVLDRSKEPGAEGEPLYLDVVTGLKGSEFEQVPVYHGRYGLSSKDTYPGDIVAAFHNEEKELFTLGIRDDVTELSLEREKFSKSTQDLYECKFWGLGSDGTVGANKNSIKIIGDYTDYNVQAYFDYDSKKSGGLTVSHLRFGKAPIKSSYLVREADFVGCHNPSYINKYPILEDLKEDGIFLLNISLAKEDVVKDLERKLPAKVKYLLAKKKIRFFCIDGFEVGEKLGLGGRINTVLQAAFFKLTDIIPAEEARQYMKEAAKASYSGKGEDVVQKNWAAIDAGMEEFVEIPVPREWENCFADNIKEETRCIENETGDNVEKKMLEHYVNHIQEPVYRLEGNELPVSAFVPYSDGKVPNGSAAFEKREIAREVPTWIPENCIQCNFCSYVCPHSVIRPAVTDENSFAIGISVMDCTGCSACASICPGKKGEKALVMEKYKRGDKRQEFFDRHCMKKIPERTLKKFKPNTIKGSQFRRPLMEFSGACGGCGETPYVKLLTQLFGERLYIANATGCSSIWGASFPSTPYTVNEEGKGPAWANSLFEDAAEFGYGMMLAEKAKSKKLLDRTDSTGKSHWIVGGDGWAYDIGFGGLDHVLAADENINVLVLDTEVYSNTGGQASKATPTGAVAQFTSSGKEIKKKDLGAIAMVYGYVYVAQVSLGANLNQTLKAFIEAESYPGPSLIIAYAPCINHGIKGGMKNGLLSQKQAVESGYWSLYRYDPRRIGQGEEPFQLDSKTGGMSVEEYTGTQIRFRVLEKTDRERYKLLQKKLKKEVEDKKLT